MLIHQYHGIDGLAWPDIQKPIPKLINGLAPLNEYYSSLEYYKNAKKQYPYSRFFLLAIGDLKNDEGLYEGLRFFFLGYDCGCYESEYNNFSTLMQDLLLKNFEELEPYRRLLNKHLLFSSIHDAENFCIKRNKLLEQGYPMETDEDGFHPIPIYTIAPKQRIL